MSEVNITAFKIMILLVVLVRLWNFSHWIKGKTYSVFENRDGGDNNYLDLSRSKFAESWRKLCKT